MSTNENFSSNENININNVVFISISIMYSGKGNVFFGLLTFYAFSVVGMYFLISVTICNILHIISGHLHIKIFSKYFCRSRMSPSRFITVSNTEYCTYFTRIDIVTNKDKHTKCKTHKQWCMVSYC